MMKVSTEFRKGVFFVRLVGRNGNGSEIKKILNIIEELEIKFVVFNLTNADDISMEELNTINCFLKKDEKRKILFVEDKRKNRLFPNIFPNIKREIDAFLYL